MGRFLRSLLAGLVVGFAQLLGAALLFAGFWVLAAVLGVNQGKSDVMGRHNVELVLGVGLGALLTAGLGFWLFVVESPSLIRGLLVGVAAGIAAHPSGWFLIMLFNGRGWRDLLVLPLLTGAFTLVIVGWATLPAPAVAGAALGVWLAKARRRDSTRVAEPRPAC